MSLAAAVWRHFRPVAPALAVGCAVLVGLFLPEQLAAVRVWDSSSAYGHCWLVLPVAAWLAWDRRHALVAETAVPWRAGALLAIPLALLWLAAERVGVMEARQLAALGLVEILVLAVLGWRLAWAMAAPLGYLIFLVPFGAFLTPALQDVTVWFVRHGLGVLGIPYAIRERQIDIPGGSFYIAEACAGLRFLIASIAFGALYSLIMFVSPWRRVAFVAASCAVPVVANGLRALGIVVLGYVLGSAQAAYTDHILYGWLFFTLVIVALALAGLPFREAPSAALAPGPLPARGAAWRAAAAAGVVVAVAGMARAAASFGAAGAAPPVAPAMLAGIVTTPPGCEQTSSQQAGNALRLAFTCGQRNLRVGAEILALAPGANPSSVVAAADAAAREAVPGPDADESRLRTPGASPDVWRMLSDSGSGQQAAFALVVNGQAALGGLRDRLTMALHQPTDAPLALIFTADAPGLKEFLASQGDMTTRAARIASRVKL
jgi:exosortase A